MWILPQQLIASSGFSATVATISDLGGLSQICESSLLARSKRMRSQMWSRRWKQGHWSLFLFGRTVGHSHASRFADWWICSLLPTRVKDSAKPASAKVKAILASCGLTVSGQLPLFSPGEFFSKTSRATLVSALSGSSEIWKQQVIAQRGDYSRRLNAARHSAENESSFSENWETPRVHDGEHPGQAKTNWATPTREEGRSMANVEDGRRWNGTHWIMADGKKCQTRLTDQVKIWPTPKNAAVHGIGPTSLPDPANLSTSGSRPASLRLNSDWVEALMDVPPLWTQIPTGFGSLATECIQPAPLSPTSL